MNTKNNKSWLLIIAIMSVFTFSSCNDNDSVPKEPIPNPRVDILLNATEELLAEKHIDFSLKLLQATEEVLPNKEQLIISPLSTSLTLAMTANGATGETRKEILSVLGYNEFTPDEINNYNQKLLNELPVIDNTATINIANSMWLNTGFNTLDSYRNTLGNYYKADIYTSDFSASKTVDEINMWCADKTNNQIPKFIDYLNPSSQLVILDALYFNGKWETPFEKENTQTGTFTTVSGTKQEVEFMTASRKNPIALTEQYAMSEFDYGNEAYSMVILLPNEGVTLADCLKNMNAEQWLQAITSMETYTIWLDIKFPKFEARNNNDLTPVFKEMGIKQAFTEGANFSNLTKDNLSISNIQQGYCIHVDENGTEASTITGTDGVLGPRDRPFYINRPFLFAIKEKSTNTILFLGRMNAIK